MADYDGNDGNDSGRGILTPTLVVLAAALLALALIPFVHPPTRPELRGEMLGRLDAAWGEIEDYCSVYGRPPRSLGELDSDRAWGGPSIRRYEMSYEPTALAGSVEEARYAVTLSVALPHGYVDPIMQRRILTMPRIEAAHGTRAQVGPLRFDGATAITPFRHHGPVLGVFAPPPLPPGARDSEVADENTAPRDRGVISVGADGSIVWWDADGRVLHRYPASQSDAFVAWLAMWTTGRDAEPPSLRLIEVAVPNRVLAMRDLATGAPVRRQTFRNAVAIGADAVLHGGRLLTARVEAVLVAVDLFSGEATPLPYRTVHQFQPDQQGTALATHTTNRVDAESGAQSRSVELVRLPVDRYPTEVDAVSVEQPTDDTQWVAYDARVEAWKQAHAKSLTSLTLNVARGAPAIPVELCFGEPMLARPEGFVAVLSSALLPARWQERLRIARDRDRAVLIEVSDDGVVKRAVALPVETVHAIAEIARSDGANGDLLLLAEARDTATLLRVSANFALVRELHELGRPPTRLRGAGDSAPAWPKLVVRTGGVFVAWGPRVLALELDLPKRLPLHEAAGGPLAFSNPGSERAIVTAAGAFVPVTPRSGRLASGRLALEPMDGVGLTERVVAVASCDGSLRLVDPRAAANIEPLTLRVVAPRDASPPPIACSADGHVICEVRAADGAVAIAITDTATLLREWADAQTAARFDAAQTQRAGEPLVHPRIAAALAQADAAFATSRRIPLRTGERLLAITTVFAPVAGLEHMRVQAFVAITGDLTQRDTRSRLHWGLIGSLTDLRKQAPTVPVMTETAWSCAGPDLFKRLPGDDLVRGLVEQDPRWPVRWLAVMDWRGDISIGPREIALINEMGVLRCFSRHNHLQTRPDSDGDGDGDGDTSDVAAHGSATVAATPLAFDVDWYEFQALPLIQPLQSPSVRYPPGAVPFAATRALVPDVGYVVLVSTMGSLLVAPLDAEAVLIARMPVLRIRLAARENAFATQPGIAIHDERLQRESTHNQLAVSAAGRVILYSTDELAAALAAGP